jgi:lysozyme
VLVVPDEVEPAEPTEAPPHGRSNVAARRRRRWLFVGLAAVIVVVLVVVAARYLWLPRYRPALKAGERYGVDVSNHQGHIDWRGVAADHISFAYIKATEGGDYVDPSFAANWSNAGAAGISRGAYHFFTLCTPGATQARNFLATVGADAGELPPAIDLELAGNCRQRPSAAVVDRELGAFLELVEAGTKRRATLYIGADFASRYPVAARAGRLLWIRHLIARPAGTSWSVWQVDGYAHVSGVSGAVDLDVMRRF